MTIQSDINANSSPIGDRVQALHNGGYGWMDPQAQTALASSPTSDQQMMSAAGSYQSVFQQLTQVPAQAVNAVGHFFDDPVLQKKPSTGLALQQYFLQRQGWAPIAQEDLTHIQKQLVAGGFLDKSEVSGVWTPASQQAFQQATSDHINKQTHEGQGFSITHALGAFLPSHWIPAIVGMAKAVPDEVRSLVGDVYADMKSLPDVLTGQVGSQHYKQGMVQNQAHAINALGGHTTPQEIQQNYIANQLNAINAVLTALPVARAATVSRAAIGAASAAAAKTAGDEAIHDAAGGQFLRGLTTDLGPEAAQRGPGVIARSLYNKDGTGLVNGRFFQNNPILRQAVPPVRALTSGDGAYYAFRTALAQPYRIAGVQALGTAVQQASLAGAAERGIAAAESKIGGRHSAFDDQIYSQGTIGGTLGLVMDMASGAFHGPLESAATRAAVADGRTPLIGVNPSHTVGDLMQGSHQAVEAMLRPVNVGWAFNRGTAAMGAEHSVEELTAKYGETFTQALLNTKINQFAAAHHAEQNMPEGLGVGTQEGQDAWRALTHEALHDPAKLSAARDELVSHLDQLAARFMRDANNIHRESRDEYRRGLDALAQAYQPYMELLAHHKDELVTPLVGKTLADAQAEHQFATTLGEDAGPLPSASTSWLRQNKTDHEQGSFGVARRALPGEPPEMETQTARLATMKADEMQARLTAAGTVSHNAEDLAAAQPYDNAAVRAVRKDALTYLSVHGGLDSREMEGVDTQGLLGMIREKAKSMPKDVDLPLDPSPELKARYQKVLDAGFKPVIGTDIGHLFAPPVVDPMMVEGYNSKLRTLAEHMGLSTLPVSIKAAGTIRSALVERELQKAIDTGVIRVPPSINGARLHTFLLDNLATRSQLSRGESIAFNAARPLHRAQAEWIAGPGASKEELRDAYRKIEDQIARNSSPLDAPKAAVVNALTKPQSEVLKDLGGVEGDVPFMDRASAERVSDLYQRAAFHEPAWAFGAGKIEDVFRAGFGFLGTNASYKVPVVRNIARLPSNLVKFRNRYRFQLDPMFSMRRVVKSALKGSLEGAPVTVRPFDHMVKAGTLDHDLAVLNRVKPMANAEGWDAMDRLAYEQDAFGLYNPRHHMALLAGELARQGMSDDQIKAKLDRAFTYGDRTALERSIGTVLYPFSFEKTLWRNVGSYLMDRPGQRLLVGAALQGYSALSQHDHIDKWLQDHGPILKEFQKLNAFDHGIGPGAIGGINALYAPAVWNLFAPQKLQPQKDGNLNVLMTVFPLMREVNSMLIGENTYSGTRHGGSLVQQAGIGLWGVQHAIDRATQIAHLGTPADSVFRQIDKVLKVRPDTYQAGQTSAYAYRNSLVSALAPVLDYNYHHRGAEKMWGPTAPAAVRGQTITKGSIDDIVHSVYPDFDPAAAQATAVTKQKQMQRYLSDLKQSDPSRAQSYQVFVDAANKVTPAIQRAENDPANYGKLAAVVDVFRQYATNLAEQDSTFLKFYNAYMISRFGPIETVTQ